ncbi:hypothetical protein Metbo_1776 [Methanobacterium lacus]|uniref:Uncharacterized protein n=1 Tax=Methanobacterium lacus (strain AL-21) TaxID=877455 RepID=F0TA49_METLA|nr:hypothetical protein [Methanobacterium lacus]ADZ09999.1 hypothetical protein Metbo_1776 [Methanobacterium lacus]
MLEYNYSHHKLPPSLPGDLRIHINFIDNEIIDPEEKLYLDLKTQNYISKVSKYDIEMNYNVNHEINYFEIEFILNYAVYTTNFYSIYTKALTHLKKILENTYFPYYQELRNSFIIK